MSRYWKELALKYYEKARILKKEAEIDLKCGAYNKAVSAMYFMNEALANAIFSIKMQKTRGFSGRARLIRILFGSKIYKLFLKLHELREKADHKELLFNKEIADSTFILALEIYSILESKIKELLNK